MRIVVGIAPVLLVRLVLGACGDATAPLAPGAGDRDGSGTGTLDVEANVEVSSSKINAAANSDVTAALTVRVRRGSEPVSTGTVTITTATGKIPLTYSEGRWRGDAPIYDEVYALDIASGADRVDAVRIEGPDVHVFTEPSPGQTVLLSMPVPLRWRRTRPADSAAVRSDSSDWIDIPDTGAFELPPSTIRPDTTRPVTHTLRLSRTRRVTPAGATEGSTWGVTIENRITVRTAPTPPLSPPFMYLSTLRRCSSSERANAWLRASLATKYRYSLPSGDSVASIDALPGFAIGPGGRPSC